MFFLQSQGMSFQLYSYQYSDKNSNSCYVASSSLESASQILATGSLNSDLSLPTQWATWALFSFLSPTLQPRNSLSQTLFCWLFNVGLLLAVMVESCLWASIWAGSRSPSGIWMWHGSVEHASEDVKLAIRYINLEFRKEIQVGNTHLWYKFKTYCLGKFQSSHQS